MSKHQARRAFTLIELLVVTSIIALLIAILLPALGAARRTAQASACMSNLRQLSLAMEVYAEENGAVFPRGHANGWGGPKWFQYAFTGKYVKATELYLCPGEDPGAQMNWTEDFHEGISGKTPLPMKLSYALNVGADRTGTYRVRDQIKQPSALRQIGDRARLGYWVYKMDWSGEWDSQFPFYLHDQKTFNISHYDGHVERVKGGDLNDRPQNMMMYNGEFDRAWDPWYTQGVTGNVWD